MFVVHTTMAGSLPPSGVQILRGALPQIENRDANLTYDFELAGEKFFLRVPSSYTGVQPYGLLVFMSPVDDFTSLPPGWAGVLDSNRLLFVAPQMVGNNQPIARRAGMAVVAARKIQEMAAVDPKRIYVGGLSGGARIASYAAFVHPELFRGVIGVCGVNFPGRVERVKATEPDDYGWFEIDEARKELVRRQTKFVIVTGSKDFRHGNLLDIFHGGYSKDGYAVKLIDVPGMEHAMCKDRQLTEALTFLDSPFNLKK